MKIKCYVSYGILGREKTNVYTIGGPSYRAKAYETGILEIPDDLKPYETVDGSIAVVLNGMPCDLGAVLDTDANGEPVVLASDGYRTRHIKLTFTKDDGDTLRRAE